MFATCSVLASVDGTASFIIIIIITWIGGHTTCGVAGAGRTSSFPPLFGLPGLSTPRGSKPFPPCVTQVGPIYLDRRAPVFTNARGVKSTLLVRSARTHVVEAANRNGRLVRGLKGDMYPGWAWGRESHGTYFDEAIEQSEHRGERPPLVVWE